jgi:hypothetical protein
MFVGGFAMARQARIVLFSCVRSLKGTRFESPPVQLSTSAGLPPRSGDQIASPRLRPGLVGWRVIAANNRELGRGASSAPGVDEAYQAIHEVQLAFDRTETSFCADAIGAWTWHILLGSEQVAVSSRAYPRQRECFHSFDQFREWFPTATVVTPHDLRPRSKIRGPLIPPSISVSVRPERVVRGSASEVAN